MRKKILYSGDEKSGSREDLKELLWIARQLKTGVMITDPEGTVRWVNAAAEAIAGYQTSEIAGKQIGSFFDPVKPNKDTIGYVSRQMADKKPFECEIVHHTKTNTKCWIKMHGQPMFDMNEELILFFILMENMTDLRAMQERAAAAESKFKGLINNMPGVFYQWKKKNDGELGFNFVSPKLKEYFGVEPTRMSELFQYIHPDDLNRWRDSVEESEKTGKPWEFEGRLLYPDHTVKWWQGHSVLTEETENGKIYNSIMCDITRTKNAEFALRRSEELAKFALEGTGDGLWELDIQANRIFYSPQLRQLLGFTSDDELNLNDYYERIHPADKDHIEVQYRKYLRREIPSFSVEVKLKCKSGKYKHFLNRGTVIEWDSNSRAVRMVGILTDIDTQKRLEAELATTANRFSQLIANLETGVLAEDENRKILLVNQLFCDMFSMRADPNDLIGLDCSMSAEQSKHLFKNPEQFIEGVKRVLAGKKKVLGEELELTDGRFFERDYIPLYIDNEYKGHLWKYTDITLKKNAAKALKNREKKYRSIIENMHLGLCELDTENKITYVNRSFCEMTHCAADELIGKPSLENDHWYTKIGDKSAVNKVRQQPGKKEAYEVSVTLRTGEERIWFKSDAPKYDQLGKFIGVTGVYLDITDQKKLEEELTKAKELAEDSVKSKEQFLANMSHEIRTPMNAILGMGRQLAKTKMDKKQQDFLRVINAAGENLLVIINDILDLSKIEAGKLDIESIPFETRDLISRVKNVLQHKAAEKGLYFETSVDPKVSAVVSGDPHRLQQVLLNLAGNSIKFTEKGGVKVSLDLLSETGNRQNLKFTVEDSGIGMDKKFLDSLFEKFSQEDKTVTRKYGGTGLGMSISKQLVVLMEGAIEVESEKHKGTKVTFYITFEKLNETKAMNEETSAIDGLALKNKKVLLADDNEMNRLVASTSLEYFGAEITEAVNGKEVIDKLKKEIFDVVLMDVQMPVMNGLDATQMIRNELQSGIPVIALTANAIKGENQRCLDAGMNDYLSKPFEEEDLVRVIQKWTAGKKEEIEDRGSVMDNRKIGNPVLYDLSKLNEISRGNKAFVTKMLKLFVQQLPSVMEEIRKAIEKRDLINVKKAAHRMKPGIQNLQIKSLGANFLEIEAIAAAGRFDDKLISMVKETDEISKKVIHSIEENELN